jgi:hypothetical protein
MWRREYLCIIKSWQQSAHLARKLWSRVVRCRQWNRKYVGVNISDIYEILMIRASVSIRLKTRESILLVQVIVWFGNFLQ